MHARMTHTVNNTFVSLGSMYGQAYLVCAHALQ